jgi:NADPH-dependent 7-cyano-7-deazaguanine reductase QueF
VRITITSPAAHLCPFKEELDLGHIVIEYDLAPDAEPVELHELRAAIDAFASRAVTHEQMTYQLTESLPFGATVVSRWHTAGMDVECRAFSGDDSVVSDRRDEQ